jgi:tRNA(Ile)-lysidine synthase TilS/MesJ
MVDLSKPGFEERARIIRYENAEKILGSDKYTKIFTAHTLSDQTETILMRLFTGTHIHGLKGIPVRRGVILRPFLCVSAEEVISFLKRYEIPWREDLSNNDCRYTRNYLRNRLIPEIQTRFPRSGTTIADITLAASENERLILQLVGKLGINKKKSPGVIEYEFDNQDISYELFSWMIAKIFRQCNHFCSRERVDESWKRFRTVAKTSELYESAGLLIEKDYRNEKKIIRGVTGNALNPDLPNGRIIVTSNPRAVHIDSNAQYLLDAVFVDYDTLENRSEDNVLYIETAVDSEIEIRGVHDGDRILLNGSFKKLKYIVNDRACSRREKKALPVFLINGNIAAIGFSFIKRGTCRIADPYLVQAGSKKILAISGRHIENEV